MQKNGKVWHHYYIKAGFYSSGLLKWNSFTTTGSRTYGYISIDESADIVLHCLQSFIYFYLYIVFLGLQAKELVCSCGTTCMAEEWGPWTFTSSVKMGSKRWSSPRQETRVSCGGLLRLHFCLRFSRTGWDIETSLALCLYRIPT